MRRAGIREARQNLSSLIEEVKKGRELVLTERGRPVARLVPIGREAGAPFPDLSSFRRSMPRINPPLSATVDEERADRV